jgi:three-Cys-motif partner protein
MDADSYHGREQTFAKHLFLDLYLDRVAFHIAYAQPDFVYVDGFSGPWQSAGQDLEDTSFMIAIRKLQYVREALGKSGKVPRMRCLFIEADKTRFETLESATRSAAQVHTKALFGEFEALTAEILRFIGSGFSLVFIDPTGWEGFAMDLIRPILERGRGEVIVNFMFDYINRFVNDHRPEIETSFDQLFGTKAWHHLRSAEDREDIVRFYSEQLRAAGSYRFSTFTPIFKPLADRAYFYLIYCTRSIRGLIEFRESEKRSLPDREKVRNRAKQTARVSRTGQFELYGAAEIETPGIFSDYRGSSLERARATFAQKLGPGSRLTYGELLGSLLVFPYVWESDVKEMLTTARGKGDVVIEGLPFRSRAPRLDSVLRGRAADGSLSARPRDQSS